ncbi:radical SAM protein [Candidatus Woesearchaeota archaeon]|nr:radical SAM protein [Candidatus Woesearchaeota archaeon]
MQKTRYFSWKKGSLAKGCRLCVKGRKLVLFVTGICSKNCWYCPLSEQKKNRDVVFANEWKISSDKDITKEAELCNAKGAGITGGDPFLRLGRTVHYIKMLKKKFGKNFHIHLYAPLNNITKPKLRKLYKAGLDEIRIHPDFYSRKNWEQIGNITKFDWDVGMEIPVIPGLGNETERMIEYFLPYIKFLNLNELEQSDTNMDSMIKKGFKTKGILDYSIKGSQELAMKIAKKYEKKVRIHYCTTKLKDAVQLASRIKIRAKNVKKDFDKTTKEGMLVRGAVYLNELKPSFGYRKHLEKLNSAQKKKIASKLEKVKKEMIKKYKIGKNMIKVDSQKLRILTSEAIARKIKEKNLSPAIVEEYPTWDATEIEVNFL